MQCLLPWASCKVSPAGDTWVHLIPHSTHLQSFSLHGAVKAGSLSEISKIKQVINIKLIIYFWILSCVFWVILTIHSLVMFEINGAIDCISVLMCFGATFPAAYQSLPSFTLVLIVLCVLITRLLHEASCHLLLAA